MKSKIDNNQDLDMALCEMTKQRDDLLEALKEAKTLVGNIVTFGGPYPYVNGTDLVMDSYDCLSKIKKAISTTELQK